MRDFLSSKGNFRKIYDLKEKNMFIEKCSIRYNCGNLFVHYLISYR